MIHLLQKPLLGVPVNWSHPLARGLVGCYLMNEGGGNKIYDLSGNQNRGTFVNHTFWTPGKFGNCLSFDGTDDCVSVPDNDIFSFGNSVSDKPFSLSAWIYIKSLTLLQPIVSKYWNNTGAICEWDFEILTTGALYAQCLDDSPSIRLKITGSRILALNTWYHVSFTYDGSSNTNGMNLYVNGIRDLAPTRALQGTYVAMHNTTSPVEIGSIIRGNAANDVYFNGLIDDCSIYNRALTDAEIARLYREPFAMFDRPSIGLLYVPPAGGQTILDYERSHRGAARGVLVGVP